MSSEQLMLWQPDSPVLLSQLPGSAEARQMTAGSGRRCYALLDARSPLGLYLRTCLASSHWGSTRFYLTWSAPGTPAGRSLYRLRASAPRISGNASSLWHTATAALPFHEDKLWPTPSAGNFNDGEDLQAWLDRRATLREKRVNGNGMGTPLAMAVKLWPTPAKGDARNSRNSTAQRTPGSNHHTGTTLSDATLQMGKLNPSWVETLQGFPVGWTCLDGLAVPANHKPSGSRPERSLATATKETARTA